MTKTYRTTLDGRTYDVVVDHASLATSPFQSSVEVYRVRKDGSRGHKFSHINTCWRVWETVRDKLEAIEEKTTWHAENSATQHVLDYYHHIAPSLRGTDEFQWCLHQQAALKAQQTAQAEQPKPPFAPGDTFAMGGQTYKVKSTRFADMRGNDKPEWFVAAWRFIKTTQKFSGNAYSYSLDDIANQRVADIKAGRIKEGPALLAQHFPKIF